MYKKHMRLPLVIFMHIPKTGGLTIRKLMEQQYRLKEIMLIRSDLDLNQQMKQADNTQIKALYGHNRFGIHQHIQKRSFTYISMLRDPVERVISTYYFILERPQNRLHQLAKKVTFEQFVQEKHPEFHVPVNNHQTRFMSGKKIPDLKLALKNMEQFFSVVGVTEKFNESIFLMKKHLGWKNISYQKVNQTNNRPKKSDLDDSLIQLIESKNQLDLALYSKAKEKLEKMLDELTAKEKQELNKYLKKQT
ncbi:hypothetical protein CX649_07020 [Bacillaceae bacterium ZC4]|uniref:sulfotransferase family 2 domain-containing protein n=1 Tax=unclassified Aeribacillus TaxID=2640495 RepID=UPI001189697A|nr:hypothetical protein CX649_07020 [Bacillaceae bacterium ZC4]MDR9792542.1 sulfotransferase family 2 domain-containing protein [Aeribacillus pallidus]